MSPRTSNTNLTAFQDFFQGWLVRQEHYLEELRLALANPHASTEDHLRDLINRVLAHYQQYYEEKSRIANKDVFLVFCAPWFSPFERSFFWIAGVKPGLAFWLVRSSVEDMSGEQVERMESLKVQTRAEEKELGNKLARIQESVAAPILQVVRRESSPEMDAAMEKLKVEMEAVLASADMLRTSTAERVGEILTPSQTVKFLTSLTEFQTRIRMWGARLSG